MTTATCGKRIALALGGGGACGLAHIGVLEVLEAEGVAVDCIAGTSMGGLVGALGAAGLGARRIRDLARGFRFPRGFLLGRIVRWDDIFRPAVDVLANMDFAELSPRLMLTATDLELGAQVVLRRGPVLPSVRATCAVPGVLAPVEVGGRWLVDGGLVNLLPVDVAWMANPDIVVAVNVGALAPRRVNALHGTLARWLMRLGEVVPNPATAKICFEILARAAEVTVARQATLATAMAGPELVVEPRLPDMGIRDFDRLEEAVESGRRAAVQALPGLRRLLAAPLPERARASVRLEHHLDPVCGMVITAARARATVVQAASTYHFCSTNCRELFERDPLRYLAADAAQERPAVR